MKSKCDSISLAALPANLPNQNHCNHCNMKGTMKTRALKILAATKLLALLSLLVLPAVGQAQNAFSTNADGSANIVAYAGPPWVVTIPTNINGLTVTSIGAFAFASDSLSSVTIPGSVTSIGEGAFEFTSLTSVTIPESVTSIGDEAFDDCDYLTAITVNTNNAAYSSLNGVLFNKSQTTIIQYPGGLGGNYYSGLGGSYTIPDSVTSIGAVAFANCFNLTNVTIPGSVTNIGVEAFAYGVLPSVYFTGNAPAADWSVFFGYTVDPTVYYLPGTTGWGNFSATTGAPTALWYLPNPLFLNFEPSFGVETNGFGFTISWATNISVVVEAATNLANPVWIPVSTNTLTGGSSYFSDPQWTNYPGRFYRLRSP
jgi:hypothetical protein